MKTSRIVPAMLALSLFPFSAYAAETSAEKDFFKDLGASGQEIAAPVSGPEAVAAPAASAPAREGRDLTEAFRATWDKAALPLGEREVMELRKYKVILVPGFLSNTTTRPTSILGVKVRFGKYFDAQMKTLKALKIDYKLVEIESEEEPGFNAEIIAKDIEASDKPVILIGHSKGGLDILETLISRKQLLPKVKRVVTIQTPFFGSPIADYILHHDTLGRLALHTLRSMGGSLNSLISLETRQRARYYRENLADINEVLGRVPFLNLATWKNEEHNEIDTLLETFRDEMLEMGLDNDGQVPVASAVLPGADHIKVEGVDHFATVMSTDSFLKYDRARLTRTLLLMALPE